MKLPIQSAASLQQNMMQGISLRKKEKAWYELMVLWTKGIMKYWIPI